MKNLTRLSIMTMLWSLTVMCASSCSEEPCAYPDEPLEHPVIIVGSEVPVVEMPAEGGDFRIVYKVLNPMFERWIEATPDEDSYWLTVTECLSDRVNFTAAPYSGEGYREGRIILTYPYAEPVSVRIVQGAYTGGGDQPGKDGNDDRTYSDNNTLGTYNRSWAECPVEDDSDMNYYYAHHICPDFTVGGHLARNYTTCFSAEDHCVQWVAAPLHDCYVGDSGRTEAYQPDPQIPAEIQYLENKLGNTGYNRGHILGSGDRSVTVATNRQVYYYSNIAPQNMTTFNNGGRAWNKLEDFISTKVCSDTTYVVIGTYFKEFTDSYGTVALPEKLNGYGSRTDVSCPTMFYYAVLRTKAGNSGKSVFDCSAGELMCAAFVLSHKVDANHSPQKEDMRSIAELEAITGQTYFANVPAVAELKSSFNAADWGL